MLIILSQTALVLWAMMSSDVCELTRAFAMRTLCALLVATSKNTSEQRKTGRLSSFLSKLALVRVTQVRVDDSVLIAKKNQFPTDDDDSREQFFLFFLLL